MLYAVVEEGLVVNVVVCDDDTFALNQGFVALQDGFWIGDSYSSDTGFNASVDSLN